MLERGAGPRALFLFPDGPPEPDSEVCSGRYRNWLGGEACPHSEDGRMPPSEGRQLPPCIVANLGRAADWRSEHALQSPAELARRPLLKCKQMFLLVLAGGVD